MRSLLLALVVSALLPTCSKKREAKQDVPAAKSPTLPKENRHYLWLEQFPSCPGGNQNMLAHHIKIKVDEGDRVTTAHFVRAPVKTYEGLNINVQKRPGKVDITFGQCNARSDDPKFRCDDDTQITWYAKTSVDVDPAQHQVIPFTAPPKLACIQGEATVVSLVAPRPGSNAAPGSGS